MHERFIGQAITPVPGSFSAEGMAPGAPALPAQFTWNDRQFEISEVLQVWKEAASKKQVGSLLAGTGDVNAIRVLAESVL